MRRASRRRATTSRPTGPRRSRATPRASSTRWARTTARGAEGPRDDRNRGAAAPCAHRRPGAVPVAARDRHAVLRRHRRQLRRHHRPGRSGVRAAARIEAARLARARTRTRGRGPLVLGPHINIYSREALAEYADLGASRWVAPVELPLDAVALVNPPDDPVRNAEGSPFATEAWAFGRMPLAFSARCFTARHHRVPKDDCGFRCIADPDGLLLASTENQPFLVLNGTQTQSATDENLLGDGDALRAAGVSRLRLSPCAQGFRQVIDDFDAVMNAGEAPLGRAAAWKEIGVPGPFSNGYARPSAAQHVVR